MSEEFIVKIGVNSINEQISPYKIFSSDYEIVRALFAPLLKASTTLTELLPNIIQGWSFNELKNEYTQDYIYFHNGRNVIAKDLEFSMVRGMLQGARRTFSQLLCCIDGYDDICHMRNYYFGMCKGITVCSKYTLKVKLKKPNFIFLKYFTRSCMSIVPIEEFHKNGLWTWKRYPVGIGAYKFDYLDFNRHYLILKKFDQYFEILIMHLIN